MAEHLNDSVQVAHSYGLCTQNALDVCVLQLWLYIDCSCLACYTHRQQNSLWMSYCEDVRNTRNAHDTIWKKRDSLEGGIATVVGLICVFVCVFVDSGRSRTVQRQIIAWWPKIMSLSNPWRYQWGDEVSIHSFTILRPDASERLALYPGRFTAGDVPFIPAPTKWGPGWRFWSRKKSFASATIRAPARLDCSPSCTNPDLFIYLFSLRRF